MKKILILLLLLIAGFVGLVMAAPLILDDEKFKSDFTNELEKAIGHKVALDGLFTISVFPKPAFVASKIRILNSEDGKQENLLTVESIEADLDLTSFLFGKTEITQAVLHKPNIYVEVLPDGSLNWMLDIIRLPDISRQEVYRDSSISFSKLDIVDGTLKFIDISSGIDKTFTGFDGEFTAKSKKGPFRFEGNVDFLGKRSELALWLEKIEEETAAPFNVMISNEELSSTLNISGDLLLYAKSFEVKGSISVESSNPVNVLKNAFPDVSIPESLSTAAATNMSLVFNNKELLLRDIVIKQGMASAVGNIDIAFKPDSKNKRYTSKFIIDNLALDGWLELTNNIYKSPTQKGHIIPLNSYLEIETGTLKYANRDIKELKFIIDADDKSYNIQNASASLIADTSVDLSMVITKGENGKPATTVGNFAFQTENMNEIATWLNIPLLSKARKNSLFSVKLTSDITGSGYNLNLDNIMLKTGSVSVSGRVGILLTKQKNLDFDLKINDLDLDKYLPKASDMSLSIADNIDAPLSASVSQDNTTKDSLSSILNDLKDTIYSVGESLYPYKDFDIRGKLDIGKFTYDRNQIGHIILSASIKDSKLTVDDFTLASRLGGTASAKGIFDFSKKDNPSFDKFSYNARLVRCSSFLNDLGWDKIFNTGRMNNIKLEGQLNGTVDNLSFILATDTAGLSITNDGKISMKSNDSPLIRFHTDIKQPQLRGFMNLINGDFNVPPQINKNFSFTGLVTMKDKNIVIKDMELSVGSDSIRGNFGEVIKEGKDIVNLQLEAGELEVTEYISMLFPNGEGSDWSDELFPFIPWLKEKELRFSFNANNIFWQDYLFKNPIILLKSTKGAGAVKVTSELEDGKVALSSSFDFAAVVPTISVQSAAKNMKISRLLPSSSRFNISAEAGDFNVSAKTQGRSLFDMAKSLSMEGNINFVNGTIKGFSLDRVVDFMERVKNDRYYNPSDFEEGFKSVFQKNTTSYDSLKAPFSARGGVIKAPDIEINYRSGLAAKTNLNYSLPDSSLSALIIVPPLRSIDLNSGYQVIIKSDGENLTYDYRNSSLVKDVEDSIKYAITGVRPTDNTGDNGQEEIASSSSLPNSGSQSDTEQEGDLQGTEPAENVDTEETSSMPLMVPMEGVATPKSEKPSEKKPENKNLTVIKGKIEALDKVIQETEHYIFETEKRIASMPSLQKAFEEMKKVVSDMKYSFADINSIVRKANPTDADISEATNKEEDIHKKASLIAKAYDKIVIITSSKIVDASAAKITDYVNFAKEIEKANPYSSSLNEYTKIIYDSDYEIKMAERQIKTQNLSSSNADKAAKIALEALSKAKIANDKIVEISGYTGS